MFLAAALLLGAACGEPPDVDDSHLGQSTAALYEQNHGARNGVILWRGFNHWWDYNHRINRLGDWVQNDGCTGLSCSARMTHAAASGSGPDTASYQSWYTTLATSSAAFRTGSKVINIKGSRGVQHDVTTTVSFLPDAELSNRSRHKVVLNGFDIESLRESGSASLVSEKTLLQFKTGIARHGQLTGSFAYDPYAGTPVDAEVHSLSFSQ